MKIANFPMPQLTASIGASDPSDRTRRVTPMLQEWFIQFAEFCAFHKLALHCGVCRSDVQNPKRAWQHWGECSGYKPPLGDTSGSLIVKTPTGAIWLGGKPQMTSLRKEQIEWLRQAEDVLGYFHLGLHCQRCEGDLVGKNADADSVYTVACRCTEYVGPNREYRPPMSLTVN